MSRLLPVGLMTSLIWFLCMQPAAAGDRPQIEFDVLAYNDSLTIWLDLTDLVNSEIIGQLKEGIRFAVRTDLALLKSRRLWGNQTIAAGSRDLVLGHRRLTEVYELLAPGDKSDTLRQFPSLAGLHRYLADSVVVPVADLADLDQETYYTVQIQIAVISLTKISLVFDPDQHGRSPTVIAFLFRKFLELTGFGREKLLIKSRPFTISEIAAQH